MHRRNFASVGKSIAHTKNHTVQ